MKKIANSPEKYSIVRKGDKIYTIIQYNVKGYSKDVPFVVYEYDFDNQKLVHICTFMMPESIRQYRPLIYKALPLISFAVATGRVKLRLNAVKALSSVEIAKLVKQYRQAFTAGKIDFATSFYPL